MKRLIYLFILLILLVLLLWGGYLWVTRAQILERYLSKQLQTKVTIEEVNVGWNALSIEGLHIANPPQARLPYAFRVGTLSIDMSLTALFKEKIKIDRVKIENSVFEIEFYNSSGSDNNWSHLLAALPSGGDSGERTFVIDQLIIENLRIDATRANGKTLNIPPIPYLEFEGIGEKDQLALSQVARTLFQSILKTLSSKSQLRALLENVPALPEDYLQAEEQVEEVKEGFDRIRRKTKEASEFLHDLFSGR